MYIVLNGMRAFVAVLLNNLTKCNHKDIEFGELTFSKKGQEHLNISVPHSLAKAFLSPSYVAPWFGGGRRRPNFQKDWDRRSR